MTRLFLLIAAVTLLGSGLLIYFGERERELWATFQTRQGEPSLELVP